MQSLHALLRAYPLMPKYLWGGRMISTAVGAGTNDLKLIHELWLDIYDYAGIVPYIFIMIYTFYYVKTFYKVCRKTYKENDMVLYLGIFICTIDNMKGILSNNSR